MSFQRVPLLANVPLDMGMAGTVLLLDSTGDASDISVQIVKGGAPGKAMLQRESGFRYEGAFESVILTSVVDTVVMIFISYENVQINANKLEITNPDARALPVRTVVGQPLEVLFAGTVEPVLGEVSQTPGAVFKVENKGSLVLVDLAPVGAGLGATLLVNDPTLKRVRFKNGHATGIICIGGPGVTLAGAAIRLEPGDVWEETEAAGAAWYGISDLAGANVNMLGVK